uniref:protein-tyrosine-phosphatase n=1 Tax=Steinernema glaseri TaxID=37863 RepID=A0A1I7YFJ4_9BILA
MCSVKPTTSNAKVKLSSLSFPKKKLPVLFQFVLRNFFPASKPCEQPKPAHVAAMEDVLNEFIEKESKLDAAMIAGEFNSIRVEQESWRLPGSAYTCMTGRKPAHIVRNRYRDILPYDSNRVKLRPEPVDAILEEDEEDGYINASHVALPNSKYTYIAAQAPLQSTLNDWWRMIFQNDIYLIVMLCKLVEKGMPKCHRYYPNEVNAPEEYGGFHVEIVEESTFHEYVKRVLRVRHPETGEERVISQLHYSEWPDHGCPDGEKQVLEMIELMCKIHDENPSTILIHCSAGCGRTGTIIAINAVREQILNQRITNLNLYDLVIELRRTRLSMVQTADQYQFLHKCVVFYCQRYLNSVTNGLSNGKSVESVELEVAEENGATESKEGNVVERRSSMETRSTLARDTPWVRFTRFLRKMKHFSPESSDKHSTSESDDESTSSSTVSIHTTVEISKFTSENGLAVEANESAECVIVKL